MRGHLWAEAANTATNLENALVYEKDDRSSYEKFWNKQPDYARYLRRFGEMAVIKVHSKIKGKLKDKGKTVMFVGYSSNSSPDTYRFYDPKTKKINISRDVTWLNKTYGDWKGITQSKITRLSQAIVIEDDDENIKESIPITRNENNRMELQKESQQQNQHTTNEMQKPNASTTTQDTVDSAVNPRVRQGLEL